jgi:hypothetical protein
MTLPSPKRLRAGRQMLVELCEIPFAGALEILRSEAYLEGTLQRRRMRKMTQMGFFQQPASPESPSNHIILATRIPASQEGLMIMINHNPKRPSADG